MFDRLKKGLKKTSDSIRHKISAAIGRAVKIDDEFCERLEEALLLSDVGASTAALIVDEIKSKAMEKRPADAEALNALVVDVLAEILESGAAAEPLAPGLNVVMMMGVNGSGKTTMIGKLAMRYKAEGRKVMLAACDTFRAAASEQLEIWAKRADVPIIRQREGADPSAVMYDAVQAARARGADLLIADTAGRLHTQSNLMRELQKIQRVAVEKAGVENFRAWLVLDSTIGRNSYNQVQQFGQAVPVDALVLTKMDGTARGGVVFSILKEWRMPIMFVGVGEKMEDLLPFNASEFSRALLGDAVDPA